MKSFTICYHTTPYNSLQRIAGLYQRLLRNSNNCVIEVSGSDDAYLAMGADIVILHVFPFEIEEIYHNNPFLKHKYVIGYLVWEASDLPGDSIRGLTLIQEVWTASRYCCKIFQQYHPQVVHIPHVIERDTSLSEADISFMKDEINYEPGLVYYLAILPVSNRRKNASGLVRSFQALGQTLENARLIIKSAWSSDPPCFASDSRIIYMRKDYTYQQINALYKLSNVYVSAHYAEGWGFTMSDAILFELPVIATGYSGNLEFMSESNSFLVQFREEYIRQEDVGFPFDACMRWAYPVEADLKNKLVLLYNNIGENWVKEKTRRALEDTKKFSTSVVHGLIQHRLRELESLLQ